WASEDRLQPVLQPGPTPHYSAGAAPGDTPRADPPACPPDPGRAPALRDRGGRPARRSRQRPACAPPRLVRRSAPPAGGTATPRGRTGSAIRPAPARDSGPGP